MHVRRKVASCVFGLLAFATHDAEAETYREIKQQQSAPDNFPCQHLISLLRGKRAQLPADKQMCSSALRPIPQGLQQFSFPDWQAIPEQEITWPLVHDFWSVWLKRWGQPPSREKLEEIWAQHGLEKDVRRRLQERIYEVQIAHFDIDRDGQDDTVMRLNSAQCPDQSSEASILSPYLGLYAYPKIAGLKGEGTRVVNDHLRLGSATYAGDIIFYNASPYVIEFNYGPYVLGPVSRQKKAQGVIDIRRLEVFPTGILVDGSQLRTSAPICTIAINR